MASTTISAAVDPQVERAHLGVQRACIWCGPALLAFFFLGLWPIAGFVPPPSPGDSADQVAAMFRDNTTGIRVGLTLVMLSGALYAPWTVALALQMRRIEGPIAPLALIQLVSGALGVLEFMIPCYIWQTAAFRPDSSSPEAVQHLNDLAWIMIMAAVGTFVVQAVVVAIAVLGDQSSDPIFPRWTGYASLWCTLLFLPGSLCVFFKSGPFAWNGLITFWMLVISFGIWLGIMTVAVLSALGRQASDLAGLPSSAD